MNVLLVGLVRVLDADASLDGSDRIPITTDTLREAGDDACLPLQRALDLAILGERVGEVVDVYLAVGGSYYANLVRSIHGVCSIRQVQRVQRVRAPQIPVLHCLAVLHQFG